MFIKRATITDTRYYNDVSSLKTDWAGVVRSGQDFCSTKDNCPFIENFTWDPDAFIYYRARAITASIPNANGDLFPPEELRTSFPTFVGKGVYYNHDSDHPDKAFGIVLDAVLHQYPDDEYVQILGAIDRAEIEQKRPGLRSRIVGGSLKTTSMSVAVQKCVCSVCGNAATQPEELCPHMMPKTASYVKGKYYRGKKAYEENYGLHFLEDSLVEVPADSTAEVFQIYACKRCEDITPVTVSPKLTEHFQKYSSLRKAAEPDPEPAKPKTEKTPFSIDEVIENVITRKMEKKVEQLVEESVRKFIDPVLKKIEDTTVPTISTKVEDQVKEKGRELGATLPSIASPKPEAKLAEKPLGKEAAAEPEVLINQILQEKSPQTPTKHVEYPEVKAERIEIDDTRSFVREGDRFVLYENDAKMTQPEVSFDVEPRMLKMNAEALREELKSKFEDRLTTGTSQTPSHETPKEVVSMKITYAKGPDFARSYFVAEDGDKILKISAAEITPVSVQQKIQQNVSEMATPTDIISQLETLSGGDMGKLETEVVPGLKAAAAEVTTETTETTEADAPAATDAPVPELEKPAEEAAAPATETEPQTVQSASLKKEGEWSWAESEVETEKPVKPADGPIMAVDSKEAQGGDKVEANATQPSKVKQYFGKLPGKGVEEPIAAINVQSSTNAVVAKKIEMLKQALEEEKKKVEKAEGDLKVEKDKGEQRDKTGMVEELVDMLGDMAEIDEMSRGKVSELLLKFAPSQMNILKQVFQALTKKSKGESIEGLAKQTLEKKPPMPPKSPSKPPFPLPDMKPAEKPPLKAEGSLPQLFISQEQDSDIVDLAQKTLM